MCDYYHRGIDGTVGYIVGTEGNGGKLEMVTLVGVGMDSVETEGKAGTVGT